MEGALTDSSLPFSLASARFVASCECTEGRQRLTAGPCGSFAQAGSTQRFQHHTSIHAHTKRSIHPVPQRPDMRGPGVVHPQPPEASAHAADKGHAQPLHRQLHRRAAAAGLGHPGTMARCPRAVHAARSVVVCVYSHKYGLPRCTQQSPFLYTNPIRQARLAVRLRHSSDARHTGRYTQKRIA